MELYYYTTTDTMKYILSDGNIYATNMKYMNDSEEYLNGLKEVREYILSTESVFKSAAEKRLSEAVYEERREDEINSFSISFTTARDLLSQWFMYAKESGVSLKMEFEDRDYEFQACRQDKKREVNYCMRPQKVYYFTKGVQSEEEYKEVGDKIIQAMQEQFKKDGMRDYDDNIERLWLKITPFVKRADFGAEEEYRLVFDFNNALAFTPRVDFRNDKHVIKPYLDIRMADGWPVTEIIVGPGFNQEAVFKGIAYFLSRGNVLVPSVSVENMKKRMESYFRDMQEAGISSEKVEGILKEWDERYADFEKYITTDPDAVNRLYQEFRNFIQTKRNDKSYQEYIRNNFFASKGIVLRKSRIPYIF